jgi:hypothetical protein
MPLGQRSEKQYLLAPKGRIAILRPQFRRAGIAPDWRFLKRKLPRPEFRKLSV